MRQFPCPSHVNKRGFISIRLFSMKEVLMFFGVAFLVVIITVIVGAVFILVQSRGIDEESKKYVDSAILDIVSDWNKQEIVKRASTEFMALTDADELDKVFFLYHRLGELKEYKGSTGQAHISITKRYGIVISANYIAKADFEAGSAKIEVTLIKEDKNWRIKWFNILSDVFLEHDSHIGHLLP
jgi:hypothetical protein